VVHSKDKEGHGDKPRSKFTKNQSQFMMGQHWLGKTKPKHTLDQPEMLSKSCYGILKKLFNKTD